MAEGGVATLKMCLAVLANVATRTASEARWQAEEVTTIAAFTAAVAAAAGDDALAAAVRELDGLPTEPVSTRYRAASDLLSHAIAVIGAVGLDHLEPQLFELLRERVAHEVAIMGDAF